MREESKKSGKNQQQDEIELEIRLFLKKLKDESSLNNSDIIGLLDSIKSDLVKKEVMIPISVFDNKELGALETVCKYLFEVAKLNYSEIAKLLNRDSRTVWVTCNNANKKRKKSLVVEESDITIPASILANRKLSVLEAIVKYLHESYNLRFRKIAILLNRDERNISGFYRRARKKC